MLTFVGQTIYMSQIYDILKEGQYQPSSPIDRRMQYHVDIKSDAFYCDERQKRSDEVRYYDMHSNMATRILCILMLSMVSLCCIACIIRIVMTMRNFKRIVWGTRDSSNTFQKNQFFLLTNKSYTCLYTIICCA